MGILTIVSLAEEIGLDPFNKAVTLGFPAGQEGPIRATSSYLADRITDNTVVTEDIDSFIDKTLHNLPKSKQPGVLEFLLAKKGMLHFHAGDLDKGLKFYDEALTVQETPSTWLLKGTGLLQVERLDEAFEAFKRAIELRQQFGSQNQFYLNDLILTWSTTALLRGLSGILEPNVSEAQKGVEEYLSVSSKARAEGLQTSVMPLSVSETVKSGLKDAMEELELMVKLFAIENPFDRWREFSKEISSVWPEDISAVDAIREQRG